MPTTTLLAVTRLNVDDARCLALFAPGLQPSDAPTAGAAAQAIDRAMPCRHQSAAHQDSIIAEGSTR